MVSKELVEQATGGREVVKWDDIVWEDDGTGAIQPSFPFIKIVQRMSGMEGAAKHSGEFWHSDREGDAAYQGELGVVALVMRDTRALFEDGQEAPSCMSSDGRKPLPSQPLWGKTEFVARQRVFAQPLVTQPTTCATCPFGMWSVDGAPPLCRESKVLLVQREDDQSLAQLRIGGMSIKPFTNFVGKYLKPKKLPLYSKRLVLTTAERKREGKTWNELEIFSEQLSIEDAMTYSEILRTERERFERTLGEDASAEWIGDDQRVDPETGEIIDDDQPFE